MTLRLVPPGAYADPDSDPLNAPARAAAAELGQAEPHAPAVVGWLSAHVAALEHVVLPAARRSLPDLDLTPYADRMRRLEHLLLQLHQASNGDGRGAGVDGALALARLRDVVTTHLLDLEALLPALETALAPEQWSALLAEHGVALRNAPSRPHPHTPHGTLGERLAFPIAAAIDRLLDGLDSRVVPPLPAQRGAETPVSAIRQPA